MKKRLVFSLAALALVGVGATLTPAVEVAQADTAGCVAKKEFRKVHRGMTKKRVARIFDTRGKQSSFYTIGGDRYESREYRACTVEFGVRGTVWVDFVNGRLDDKMAIW